MAVNIWVLSKDRDSRVDHLLRLIIERIHSLALQKYPSHKPPLQQGYCKIDMRSSKAPAILGCMSMAISLPSCWRWNALPDQR